MKNKNQTQLNSTAAIVPIGTLADALGVHQRTLRIWDREGVLSPRRSSKNRRNYSFDDIEKAKLVMFLTRNLTINLTGVKFIMAMLQDNKIATKDALAYVSKIAHAAKISSEQQKSNILKISRRGKKQSKAQ